MGKAKTIVLTDEQRETLARWSRNRVLPKRQRRAAQILLLAAKGIANEDIAAQLRVSRNTVSRCRKRFRDLGLERIGRKARRDKRNAVLQVIVGKLAFERPPGKRWTTRMLARAARCSQSTVLRCCRDHDIPVSRAFLRRVKEKGLILEPVGFPICRARRRVTRRSRIGALAAGAPERSSEGLP